MSQIPELQGGRALEHNAPFETGKGISNKDGTASIVAAASGFTWTGDLDLNDNLDVDLALTATGDVANIAATMSHASQTAEALDVSIAQITTARTGGDLIAIKASITSLNGSTAGVDHVAYDAACTAGDADSDHIVLRQGTGFSHTIDTSAASTGEVAWRLGANKADALSILDSTGDMVVYTTTTATPGIAETFARTGAGNAHSIAATVNSASATVVGLAVSASQITTARTSGTLSGIKSTVVSLSGDTAGVDYYAYEAAVTAGEAGADHFAFKVGAGFDALIDSSSAATGENDWLVPANVADALTVRGASLNYLTLKTTTATPNWASSLALTATGNAWDIDATINSATGVLIGVDVTAAQISTNRTGGTVTGVKAAVTSLSGDTSGVDYYAFEAAVTAGEANADHFAFKVGAGFDAVMDLSSCATGEADVVVADNLASAFEIRESTNTMFKVVTSNSAEHVEATGLRNVQSTAVAITGTTVLTLKDSGGVFTVSQGGAYDIDLPSPTSGAGCRYLFQLVGPANNDVTITVAGGAATFEGTIVNDVTSVLPATGATLTFENNVAALGDTIEAISTSTSKYLIRAVCSANGGITIT